MSARICQVSSFESLVLSTARHILALFLAMANLKSQVNDREAAAIRKRLSAWARDTNPSCADCGRANPSWASVNLGVLVCLECAGKHRGLGVHVSKMRSITLDTVLPQEARFLLHMSNSLANRWWEARLSAADKAAAQASAAFVEQKYSQRKWALQEPSIPQPSQGNMPDTHPWAGASVAPAAHSEPPSATDAQPVPSDQRRNPGMALPTASTVFATPRAAQQIPQAAAAKAAPMRETSLIDLDGSTPRQVAASDAFDPFAVPDAPAGAQSSPAEPAVSNGILAAAEV